MLFKDLSRSGGETARYVGQLADANGARNYELAISGPRRLAEKVFAKAAFEIFIDAQAGEQHVEGLSRKLWERHATRDLQTPPAESIDSLRKRLPKTASPATSLVVALRRTEGQGTFWPLFVPVLLIPRGVSLLFALPPVCNCFGAVFPAVGDPDLFLSLGSPLASPSATSTRAGTAIDTVSFRTADCMPWTQVMPWIRIFGFTSCQTGFLMSGFSTFP